MNLKLTMFLILLVIFAGIIIRIDIYGVELQLDRLEKKPCVCKCDPPKSPPESKRGSP